MRIMGLDIGTKNIGIAVSDETATIAQGREVLRRKGDAASRIGEIAAAYGAGKIIVGLPVNMDGTSGERARDSETFAERLREITGLPVELWDERLSTKEAEDVMIQADISRKKRRRSLDKMAAQLILQSYLDSLDSQ